MKPYRLYFRGQLISEHDSFDEAEANARWTYFEFTSTGWDGENMPPGFLIVCVQEAAA